MWFLLPYVLFFLSLSFYVFSFDKHEGFLFLNPSKSSVFDIYFKYLTYLGDGVVAVVLSIILLLFNRKWGLGILVSYALSGGIAQLIKHLNENVLRPAAALGAENVHQIEGVELSTLYSFPSGHTTTAFALFMGLAIILKNKKLGLICLLFAILSGYSRIYLSQHFPIDVLVGSVIGVVSSLLVFSLFNGKKDGV